MKVLISNCKVWGSSDINFLIQFLIRPSDIPIEFFMNKTLIESKTQNIINQKENRLISFKKKEKISQDDVCIIDGYIKIKLKNFEFNVIYVDTENSKAR